MTATIKKRISIIIPCYNEEANISRCLHSLQQINYPKELIQVIVADNGSSDNSRKIARTFPVLVVENIGCTIGAVRNFGASFADGEILAFVDADCEVTEDWVASFIHYFTDDNRKQIGIVGSPPLVPPNGNLIERAWFSHRKDDYIGEADYVGSANMVISKELFNALCGFHEGLTSGEDFDLCARARNNGFKIISDYRIVNYHHGYPKNIRDFIQREVWHGKGMVADFHNPLKSRPLLLSIEYLFLNLLIVSISIVSLVKRRNFHLKSIPFLLMLEIAPVFMLALKKSIEGGSFKYLPILGFLYYIYGSSRSVSLLIIIKNVVLRENKAR
jgi:glycosyltransferase involved in cell wall biosynthesis